ncbi:MAG TPA: phenylalanine--tRNA ligase subunit beta [Chloroflexia bacterium]|nr:phenylalanine--tRNA ligase subunit beta [Chloroflexia bacterium]
MPLRAPLSWLRDYIEINVPPEELARRLTLAGQEVEHLITIGDEWENIYTGVVAKLEQHPNADRLYLATVEYGAGNAITVVTGAPNIEEGQKVVLGLLGARYLDQHSDPPRWSRLKPAKIRGVQTEGMVMSEAELAISEEHEGIIVLDPATTVGLPAREVLGDVVLHIDVTPNNGRVLSMIGLAREIKAIFGGQVRYPDTSWEAAGPPVEGLLDIEIKDPDLCARYTGAVIQGVRIGQSPGWMQRRITLAGMRPINTIVDITNYVMLEMGQPLHAFDYHAVEGRTIVVRRARPGEKIITLDHVERTLDPKMLAICDVEKPLALAGVMGGANSEIGDEDGAVVDVLLESAHFDPRSIRRTARLLRLPSEASHRFERFVDPELTVPAMQRAAQMMHELAGGTIAQGYVDNYPRPAKTRHIHFDTYEVPRLLGVKIPPSQIADILKRLDFEVDVPHNVDAVGHDATLLVDVPTYRNDVTIPADLVEEVARISGYDQIPETLLEGGLPPQEVNYSLEGEARIRDIVAAAGVDEVICYSLTFSGAVERLAALDRETAGDGARPAYDAWDKSRPLVTIVNPISSKQDVMRPTLLPNMLDTLRQNLKVVPEQPVRIFELGRVYITPTESEIEARSQAMALERERYPRMTAWEPQPEEARMPLEPRRVMGLLSGPRKPRTLFAPDAGSAEAQHDFFDAKGVVEELVARLNLPDVRYEPVSAPLLHPGRSAAVYSGDTLLGVLGEMHSDVAAAWEMPGTRIAMWDLDVEAILAAVPGRVLYSTISPYQPVRQDMAFVVGEQTPAAALAGAIRRAGGSVVTDVVLFDVYRGTPVPEGSKSLAYALTLNSPDHPLTEDEIAKLRKKVEGALRHEFGATLRS